MDTRLVRKKAFLFACAIAISTNALGDGVEENFSELFDAVDLVALDIDVQAANIVVVGGDEARARVNWSIDYRTDDPEKAAELRDAMRLEASTESGQLRVLLRQGVGKGWKRFFQWGSQPRIRLEVTVPSSMQVTARTSGGGIEVLNMNGDCIVKTSGGRIEMDRINGDVMARTSGGAIRLDAIDGNMDVKTSGGAIKIEDSMGSVEAKTSGGSIDIETMGEIVIAETTGGSVSAEVSGIEVKAVKLNTMGGGISIALDPRLGGTLDAKTEGGRVRLDDNWNFEGEREGSEMRGSFGSGDAEIHARTFGGGIRIKTL